MKSKLIFILFIFLKYSGFTQNNLVSEQSFAQFKSTLLKDTSQLYILNFWATWCKPCLEEMPHFVSWYKSKDTTEIRLIFVNLDFNKDVHSILYPFWKKRKYGIPCVHLTDSNPDTWINQVNPDWSGAIPATAFVYKGKFCMFRETVLTPIDLELMLNNCKQH
jgi:thiol-disulfide isomerase/thioredoxin